MCALLGPHWTDWPPLLYLIWLWPSAHLEVEGYDLWVQTSRGSYYTDFSTRTSSLDADIQTLSDLHITSNYQNRRWITAFRRFSLTRHHAPNVVEQLSHDNEMVKRQNSVVYYDIKQKRPGCKTLSFTQRMSQHLLFVRPLPWPTFHGAVTFDVEDLIEKKVNLSISKCVYNKVLKIGPAPVWHLCHELSGHIDFDRDASNKLTSAGSMRKSSGSLVVIQENWAEIWPKFEKTTGLFDIIHDVEGEDALSQQGSLFLQNK